MTNYLVPNPTLIMGRPDTKRGLQLQGSDPPHDYIAERLNRAHVYTPDCYLL